MIWRINLHPVGGCYARAKIWRDHNRSEFISRDLDLWACANNVTLNFSRPGKPTDNGFINSKFRAECLNAH